MVREIFGKKIGMTQVFTEQGKLEAVTLIEVGPCKVIDKKKYPQKEVVVIGYGEVKKEKKKKKPQLGYFKKINQPYFRYLKETEKIDGQQLEKGADLGVEVFSQDEKIDITAISIGRGFQGGIKRHNWVGQPKTHGSTTHRRIGSAGASAYPSKIVKGHPMPGHMGNVKVTIRNLKIMKIDKDKGLLFIKGSCPGSRNSVVIVKKTAA